MRQQHVKERQAFLLQKSAFLRPAAGTSNASNARGLGTAQWRETAGAETHAGAAEGGQLLVRCGTVAHSCT